MNPVNKLGLTVAGITVIVAAGGYGIWRGVGAVIHSLRPTATPTPSPTNPTTAEIEQNIATLADQQGEELRTKLVQTLGSSDSYTARYLATLPANLPQDKVLDKTKVAAFVNENKGTLLPSIAPTQLTTTTQEGKDAIKAYLDGISSTTNPAIKAVSSDDIQKAYQTYYADPQHSNALTEVKTTLQNNVNALKAVPTPQEAMAIQTKLVAASEALVTNVGLLITMPKDLIGGLVAAKNIEDLGPVFAAIQHDIDALQHKYTL